MVRSFLWIARAEGVSLLVLMGIAMPLKYMGGFAHATEVPGWIHGVLFVIYVGLLALVTVREGWSPQRTAVGLLAAFLPGGTFGFEAYLARSDPSP